MIIHVICSTFPPNSRLMLWKQGALKKDIVWSMAKAGDRRSFLTHFSCKRSTLNAHCHFLLYGQCDIFSFRLWYSFSLLHPHLLHCHFFSHLKHESWMQFCNPLTTMSIKTGNLEDCRQQMEIMPSNVLIYIYIFLPFLLLNKDTKGLCCMF